MCAFVHSDSELLTLNILFHTLVFLSDGLPDLSVTDKTVFIQAHI